MTLCGAYYYGWHKGPWLARTARPDDLPLLGEYDNTRHGPAVTAHMGMAKQAGINFLAVSWWGNDYGYVLDAAKQAGIKIVYFYESLRRSLGKDPIPLSALPLILNDMAVIREDMQENAWLRIDGRPVLMIYVTRCYRNEAQKFFSAIRSALPGVFLVGDELWWQPVPDWRIEMFDAVTFYNMFKKNMKCFQETSPEKVAFGYLDECKPILLKHAEQCRRLGIPLWGCAMPGYDDSGVRPEKKHPPVPGLDGEFFRRSLADALDISIGNQALTICSMNENYESTGIEPRQSYGNLYLDILKKFKAEI